MRPFILPRYILREHLGPFCFSFAIFRRMTTGKFTPRSLRAQSWFGRFSLRNLFGIFRRRRKMHDEALRRLHLGERLEVPDLRSEDQNNAAVVLHSPQLKFQESVALPSAPTLSSPQLEFTPVAEILHHFTNHAHADLVLLVDRNGVPLAHDKPLEAPLPSPAELEMMAKLAAGQIAATREMARTVDADDGHIDSILQEGASRNSFIYPIDEDHILIALVDKAVVIGLVRLQANATVTSLRKALEMI